MKKTGLVLALVLSVLVVVGAGCGRETTTTTAARVATTVAGGPPTWSNLKPTGELPAGRVNQTMIYDAGARKMIMFGGRGATSTISGPTTP